jgi:hypothetical protein
MASCTIFFLAKMMKAGRHLDPRGRDVALSSYEGYYRHCEFMGCITGKIEPIANANVGDRIAEIEALYTQGG